jgi:L-rhamnose-H+ transport protein
VNSFSGFLCAFLAGAGVGFSMWPLKWARSWKWENFWLPYSILSLIVVPFGLAFGLLPHLSTVYKAVPSQELVRPLLMGAAWGVAQLGAGICVHRLGLAVAGAVLNGIGGAVGTITPLLSLHHDLAFTRGSLLIMGGTVLMLAGAAFCGWSGYLREVETRERDSSSGFGREQVAMRQAAVSSSAYLLTLGIAVGSGVLSALLNIALAYGSDLVGTAQRYGARPAWAPLAVWPIALLGGSIANIAYSLYLISKNKTWANYSTGWSREMWNPALSACLWMGGIALYSSATTFLGSLGISIGFAVFMITMILSGQAAGLLTREWGAMKPQTLRSFAAGVTMLVAAVLTIGIARYYSQ